MRGIRVSQHEMQKGRQAPSGKVQNTKDFIGLLSNLLRKSGFHVLVNSTGTFPENTVLVRQQ